LGTIYGNRDLVPVVLALGTYLERHPAARSDGTKLRVAGSIGSAQLTELRRVVRDKGLESHVEFLGVVPRTQALEILLRSRLCIVLAQGQVIEIPAKIYEAIGARIPTAIVAPRGSASAAEAARIGAVFVDEADGSALTTLLEAAATGALDVSAERAERVGYAGVAKDFLGIVKARAPQNPTEAA
jgi:glycosyltransferase involved in cell wall biosynthesis